MFVSLVIYVPNYYDCLHSCINIELLIHAYAPRVPRHLWCCRGTDLTPAYIFEEVGICFKHLTSNHAILIVYPSLRDFNLVEYMGRFHPL